MIALCFLCWPEIQDGHFCEYIFFPPDIYSFRCIKKSILHLYFFFEDQILLTVFFCWNRYYVIFVPIRTNTTNTMAEVLSCHTSSGLCLRYESMGNIFEIISF